MAFQSDPLDYDRRDIAQQRQILTDKFAGAGWCCDRLTAAAATADDFYFDAFTQVHMPTWSSGRVSLIGDAACCASPLSGMGTSLALVGAYVLSGELGPAGGGLDLDRVEQALASYERLMRPYVAKCQDIPNSIDRYAPKTDGEIKVTQWMYKAMQRWPFRNFAARKWFKTAESIALPDYPNRTAQPNRPEM